MSHGLLADVIVLVHAGFVAFVVAGALLVARWPRLAWLHLPCVAWGILVELCGWVCPLTPLEVRLRRQAGEAGYTGSFLERTLEPLLYPEWLTRELQVGLGLGAAALNVALYAALAWRRRRAHHDGAASTPKHV